MTSSIAEQVKQRRDLDQIRTAKHVKRFSGVETLLMGLNLSAIALRISGEVVKRVLNEEREPLPQ